jgi:hypothetical protein
MMLLSAGCGFRLTIGSVNLHVTPALVEVSTRLMAPTWPVLLRVVAAKVGATAAAAINAAALQESARRMAPERALKETGKTRDI